MIIRQLLYMLIVLLLAVANNGNSLVQAQQGQSTVAGSSATPGEGDIAIMQKEIKWGMQEMQRYKLLRGEWPVRPMATMEKEIVLHQRQTMEETKNVRGHTKPKATAHSSYWDLLVSVF